MPTSPTEPKAPRRPLSRRKKLAFAIVPLLAFLLLAEVAIRIVRAPLWFGSFRTLRLDQARRGYPVARDDRLGYVPRAGAESHGDNQWGTTITIDADGMRTNGPGAAPPGRPIVAVGDSFTFGDQVSDDETWPAYLQGRLGAPVRNAGVFGYSLAQAVLRAEDVVPRVGAAWLVVSFLDDDLRRAELKKRYTPLPWFDIVDGALVLRNVPVVEEVTPDDARRRAFKDALGHSALLDGIFASVLREWWVEQEKQVWVHGPLAHPPSAPGTGAKIGLLLVDRIDAFCKAHGCKLMFVLQGKSTDDDARAVIARAKERGVPALDLVAAFEAEVAKDPRCRARWFDGHMTAEGNRWAAERIAAAIEAAR